MEKWPSRVVILAVLVVPGLIGWGVFGPDDAGRDAASAPKATDVPETGIASGARAGTGGGEGSATGTTDSGAGETEEQNVTATSGSGAEPENAVAAVVPKPEEPVIAAPDSEAETPEVETPGADAPEVTGSGSPAIAASGVARTASAEARTPGAREAEAPESETPGEPRERLAAVTPEKEVAESGHKPVAAAQKEEATPAPGEATVMPGEAITMAPEEDTAEEETGGDPGAPRFDVVRVDRDGQTVVAGTARPGDPVEILLDGEVVGSTRADARGAFATVVFADPTGEARRLQLRTQMPVALATPVPRPAQSTGTARDPGPAAPEESTGTTAETVEEPAGVEDTAEAATTPAPAPSASGDATTGPAAADTGDKVDVAREMAPRVALSAPVIILPMANDDDAPVLVQPRRDNVALLQPRGKDIDGVVIDQITYGSTGTGDVLLAGRGRAGTAIRIYGNGERLGETPVSPSGIWRFVLSSGAGIAVKLFRFDAVDAGGQVTSRIEAPFEYAELSPRVFRERRVVIQKGDVLWRLAEQYYGKGIRYSLIFAANAELIRDPDLIYPGQVFSIPDLQAAQ